MAKLLKNLTPTHKKELKSNKQYLWLSIRSDYEQFNKHGGQKIGNLYQNVLLLSLAEIEGPSDLTR